MNNLEQNIKEKKLEFITKYNPNKCVCRALSMSIAAAVQHNKLYSYGLPQKDRKIIRDFWTRQLDSYTYNNVFLTISSFEKAIVELKDSMNQEFREKFCSDGFRISHSQKSLSVFIKHMWCMDEIDEPAICPVDRIILSETKSKDISWTKVNDLAQHQKKFLFIQNAANNAGLSVAQWELLHFKTN